MHLCIQVRSPCPAHFSASQHRFPFPEQPLLLELSNLTRSSPRCVALGWVIGRALSSWGLSQGRYIKMGRVGAWEEPSLLVSYP